MELKKILVCTDGSAYAESCCRYAVWLANRSGASIEALYVSSLWDYEMPFVADLGGSLGASPYQGMIDQLQEIEKHKAEMIRTAVSRIMEQAQLQDRFQFHHETGLLVDCLEDFETGDEPVNLVIVGKRGENAGQARGHLGGNMERVVRSSKMPCLVANREFNQVRQIVFAYDGSPSGNKALAWLAQSPVFDKLRLNVVSVGQGHGDGVAAKCLQDAENALQNTRFSKVDFQMLSGEVESSIAGHVKKTSADLLVMGAYGHSRIRQLLIGSTTSDLIRECQIPVLCFR